MDLLNFLSLLVKLYSVVLFVRVIFSWIQMDPFNPAAKFVYTLTEPLLGPIRRNLPVVISGMDFSPIIAVLLVQILYNILLSLLR